MDARAHDLDVDALRSLIQKIESHADPEIPGSEALAAFLLAPYVEMAEDLARSRRKAPAKKPEAAPAARPEAVPAPLVGVGGTP
ncbi:hypothetical protein [Sorangium sp. So ce854]|uniref:hypothetical protein n=1 Tax=Sorangium sp. So ce854 TaxID=3133322 RepID=UPI003F5DB071